MLSDTEEEIEYIRQAEGIISLKLQEGVENKVEISEIKKMALK